MTTFNRERFKAAKLEVNKKVTDEVQKRFANTDSKRGDYHKIDEGVNYFRMMPPHNENEPSFQPKVVYWMDCKIQEVDSDGKPTGKSSIKSRPIFDSKVHGGTKKDIIDEYINFTKKVIFDSVQDKDERKKLLAPIQGWRSQNGKWNPGILPNHSYVCYATKGEVIPENIGRLELWENDKKALEKLNISEKSDEPIITDSFSDPDNGVQFVITKGRDEKDKPYTVITKRVFEAPKNVKPGEIEKYWNEFANSQKVSDEVLMRLSEMEPLSSQFKDAYKKADFERALEALQMFDAKHGFGTFDNDEFVEIVTEIAGYYKEEANRPKENVEISKDVSSSTNEDIDLYDMTRDELKAYIKEKSLPIKILSSMKDDMIREMILSYESEAPEDNQDPSDASESNDDTPESNDDISDVSDDSHSDNTSEDQPAPPVMSLKDRLAKIKREKEKNKVI